jgi:hypothetical protein
MSSTFPHRHAVALITAAVIFAVGACQPVSVPSSHVTGDLLDSAWPEVSGDLEPEGVWQAAHLLIEHYLTTTDTITQDGGEGPGRMAGLVTAAWLPTEEAAFAHYRRSSLRTIGETVVDSLVIQSSGKSPAGGIRIDAFACVDARWVWLLPRDAPDPPEGLIDWLRWGGDDLDVSDEDYDEWSEYLDLFPPLPGEREAIVFWIVGDSLNSLAIDGTVNWEGADPCHITPTE